jgi:branched-chain amino acid aminotransferase
MQYFDQETILYLNGAFVKAHEAKIDLYSQTLHYGYGVFEGIRSYRTIDGETRIFKAAEHFERLRASANAINLPFHFDLEELTAATYQVLAMNNLQDAYIRPLVFAPPNMTYAFNTTSFITIQAWKMQPFLGEKHLKIMSSSFQRPNPAGFHIHAKACGHYVNSIVSSQDAKRQGYDEALLKDMEGYVAEGPGANVFYEKNNQLFTPAEGYILNGITRQTILEICRDLQISVTEKQITHAEMKEADAAFFCGTGVEVIGWESLDNGLFPVHFDQSISGIVRKAYLSLVRSDMVSYENCKQEVLNFQP